MAARDYPSAVLCIKYRGKAWKRNLDPIPKNVTNIIIDMQIIFIYWWHAQEFIIWIYIYGLRRIAWGLNFFFPRCLFVLYIQKFCYKGCYKFISILCWLFSFTSHTLSTLLQMHKVLQTLVFVFLWTSMGIKAIFLIFALPELSICCSLCFACLVIVVV